MKTFSIAAGLGLALIASAAVAADLPRKTAPVAPAFRAAPAFTWTGFYAGVNAGYGFGKPTGTGSAIWENTNGFVGGGQIGYNQQFNQLVLGVEADLQGTGMSGKQSGVGVAGDKSRIPYFGTVRARAGYAIDRFMPYVTGGFAYGGSHAVNAAVGKANNLNYGWAIGGGVEYAFTNNITAKVEGLYVDLAEKSVVAGRKYGNEFGVVRAGLNYKF